MDINELRHELQSTNLRMHEIVDRAEAERRELTAEEDAEFERLHQAQNAIERKIARAELLARSPTEDTSPIPILEQGLQRENRPVADTLNAQRHDGIASPEYVRAFNNYLRGNPQDLSAEDRGTLARFRNVMQTTQGQVGGYTVPPLWQSRIWEALKAFGGMREVSTTIRTDTAADLPFITNDDTGNIGELVGEGGTINVATDPAFGMRYLKGYVFTPKIIKVSWQLLNDAGFDIEAYLTRIATTRVGRIQNQYFTTGNAANQPQGVATGAILGVTGAAQADVTWDELTDLEHSVDPAYRGMARYMFNDATLKSLKQKKDGESRPLWVPSARDGEPSTINGYPYTINQDVATMATTARSILFGDFSYYHIRDINDMMMLRLDEKYAENLQVGFLFWLRSDGGLIDPAQGAQSPIKYFANA